MKCKYWGDEWGDIPLEAKYISQQLNNSKIKHEMLIVDIMKGHPLIPPLNYDVLFFDWGGMSIGNSIMESNVREMLKLAIDFPNKYFVMTSEFTKRAMEDAQEEWKGEIPVNIFLNIDDFIKLFKKDN